MDAADEPNMACHQVSEAEPAVQEEARVIGYFDLENSGLQLVEGDNTFYLPPEALREHVLMSQEGKEGQNIIVVLGGSEDDVVQAFARNSETLLGDQATFTVNQLGNAISATVPQQFADVEAVTTTEGQQVLILSEGTTEKVESLESAPTEESAAVLETQLLYQEVPKDNLPGECATAGTSIQAELQPRFEQSPEMNGKEAVNVISDDSHDKTGGAVHPSQENSEFQGEGRSVPLATSPLGVHVPSDGADSFRISISLAQCGQRKIVVSPGATRAAGAEEKQNGTVGRGIVHVKEKHSSHKPVPSVKGRDSAIDIDSSASKTPLALSRVGERLEPAKMDELPEEKETTEIAVQKDINSTKAEGETRAFAEHTSEGTKALDLVHIPKSTSEHITADPSTACMAESRSDQPAQVVAVNTVAGSEDASGKGLSAELLKRLNDSENMASKPLLASKSVGYIQDCSGVTTVAQENFATTTAKATTYTCSDGGLSGHREAVEGASNEGTVTSSTEGGQQRSFCDEASGLASSLKQERPKAEEIKRHLTESKHSTQCGQFQGGHLLNVRGYDAAYMPPEKYNSRTSSCVCTGTEEISLSPMTTTPESSLKGEEKCKGSVIKSAVTQKELCQTSHGVDTYDFEESDGENTLPVKNLPLEKREEITEADLSQEQEEQSQEVKEAVQEEQNADIAKSNVSIKDLQGVSQQLPEERALSEKPSSAPEDTTEKLRDFETKPGQLEAQDQSSNVMKILHEKSNEQEETASNPTTSNLTAGKFESCPTSNTHEVPQSNPQSNVFGDHQKASRDTDAMNALQSKFDMAEDEHGTHSLSSVNIESDENLQETEARNVDSVCDKAACGSLDSQETECEHNEQASKHRGSTEEYQKPNVEFQAVHREPVEKPESSNCKLQDNKRDNGDVIEEDSQNVQALSALETRELNTKEQVCAESSDEKLFAALDLVPCQESSPPPSSVAVDSSPPEKLDMVAEKPGPSPAASGSLHKKKQKKEQKNECSFEKPGPSSQTFDAVGKKEDAQQGTSSGKKRWSLRTPTKPRKRFVIPDSDDEDFESYESEDVSAETLKSKSEEAFDVLLNVFKTEQAKKAANHAEPVGKKNAKRGGSSSSKRKPSFSKSLGSACGAAEKERATSKTERIKAKEKTSTRKSHPVQMPPFVTNEVPVPKRAQKRRAEPAKAVAFKKTAGGNTTTPTPFVGNRIPTLTELFAGDIRIRCQKPSFSSNKAATNYHCSKCGFRSTRMENIVRHHKQDCPYSKSLFEWDTEPSKSTNNNSST